MRSSSTSTVAPLVFPLPRFPKIAKVCVNGVGRQHEALREMEGFAHAGSAGAGSCQTLLQCGQYSQPAPLVFEAR